MAFDQSLVSKSAECFQRCGVEHRYGIPISCRFTGDAQINCAGLAWLFNTLKWITHELKAAMVRRAFAFVWV